MTQKRRGGRVKGSVGFTWMGQFRHWRPWNRWQRQNRIWWLPHPAPGWYLPIVLHCWWEVKQWRLALWWKDGVTFSFWGSNETAFLCQSEEKTGGMKHHWAPKKSHRSLLSYTLSSVQGVSPNRLMIRCLKWRKHIKENAQSIEGIIYSQSLSQNKPRQGDQDPIHYSRLSNKMNTTVILHYIQGCT